MPKYNLHVTHVPDHKAQVVIARIIVGSNSIVSMQQAVVMASNPPLLLFHNLERKELGQHVEQLNSLGVKFDISEVQEELDASEVNFGGRGAAHKPEPAPEPEPVPEPAPQPAPEAQPKPPKQPGPLWQSEPPARAPAAHTPTHAAEHEHKQYSGYRTGGLGEEASAKIAALKAAEDASRKKSLTFTFIAIAILLVIGVVMFSLPKGNKFTIERTPELVKVKAKPEKKPAPSKAQSGGNAGQPAAAVSGPDSTAARTEAEPRVQATERQKQRAGAYVDSAKANDNDLMKNVVFYKTAISFNRQNLAAWQGLLQAYRELHMDANAHETERQMKEIFGTEMLSIGNIVKSYGELTDAYVNGDGAYMVEYQTAKSSKVDILRDVFGMTRAVRAACNCHNISVYAATGSGKGVTAHSTRHTSVHSLSEFMRQAEITWIE